MRVNTSKRNIGINYNHRGESEIRVWAPLAESVDIVLSSGNQRINLERDDDGYWKFAGSGVQQGSYYKISVDNNAPLPDPASLSQPLGVHDSSMAIDVRSFPWTDDS
jgi:maltooligosyltrehalose trehalohydrolase